MVIDTRIIPRMEGRLEQESSEFAMALTTGHAVPISNSRLKNNKRRLLSGIIALIDCIRAIRTAVKTETGGDPDTANALYR